MGRDALILGLAVACSLGIMGVVIWSQRPVPVAQSAAAAPTPPPASMPTPTVDTQRVAELKTAIESDPEDVASLVALANVYFEAHSFEEALPWYEDALALRSDDIDSSTNLGVSYFYVGQAERAIAQFEHSLGLEPDHPQTLLNLGIVRAFGLDDVAGATEAWERVLEVAPDAPQARAAREALSRVAAEQPGQTSGGGAVPDGP